MPLGGARAQGRERRRVAPPMTVSAPMQPTMSLLVSSPQTVVVSMAFASTCSATPLVAKTGSPKLLPRAADTDEAVRLAVLDTSTPMASVRRNLNDELAQSLSGEVDETASNTSIRDASDDPKCSSTELQDLQTLAEKLMLRVAERDVELDMLREDHASDLQSAQRSAAAMVVQDRTTLMCKTIAARTAVALIAFVTIVLLP